MADGLQTNGIAERCCAYYKTSARREFTTMHIVWCLTLLRTAFQLMRSYKNTRTTLGMCQKRNGEEEKEEESRTKCLNSRISM